MKQTLIIIGRKSIYLIDTIRFKKYKSAKDNNQQIKTSTLNEIIKINKDESKEDKKNKRYLLIIPPLFLLFTHNIILFLEISIIIIIFLLYLKFLPKIKEEQRKQEILKYLPYALRQLSTQLKAGIGLYDSMKTISKSNYGSLSEEFNITLTEIQYGVNYIEAFNNLSKRTNTAILNKVINQIIRTLNNGGNLADTLNSIANENSYNLKIKYKEYSQKLNAIMLIYMFIAVLLPVIAFIMIIAATTVMGSIIKEELLLILYLIFFPMIILFMIIIIKRMEPTI
ncbi:MAG: type II secretion system F family protein [Methanosphaera sp.]|nr:type II secretion system F family protein [Methanosphaera sp.]